MVEKHLFQRPPILLTEEIQEQEFSCEHFKIFNGTHFVEHFTALSVNFENRLSVGMSTKKLLLTQFGKFFSKQNDLIRN